MNKEGVFTLAQADSQAHIQRKTRQVSSGNFPHPQAFPWFVHGILGLER